MTMMHKLLPLALLLLQAVNHAAGTAATLEFDTIVMQLRSKSDSDSSELLDTMLHVTKRYLNDYFSAYYTNAEPVGYFDQTLVTANSFGIQGVTGSFINTLEFNGILGFNSEPAPSPAFVNNLLTNAFQGYNLDLFLETLLSSDDPFLRDLTHVIIEIDENAVTEKGLQDSDSEQSIEDSEDDGLKLEGWAKIAIHTTAGVVGAMFLITVFCLCRCWCCKRQVHDDPGIIKVKAIEFPTPVVETKPQSQRLKYNGYRQSRSNLGSLYNGRDRSPSPVRSLASQESSLFTYNPTGLSRDLGTLSLGSVSNMNIDTPHFDLDAWQRQNVISTVAPAPFGQDISAIEQKDQLSLIEEGDENALRPRESCRHHSKKKKKTTYLEVRASKPRKPNTRRSHYGGNDYSTEESNSSSSDVINDLRNLSLQIDKHRRSKSSRTYGQ